MMTTHTRLYASARRDMNNRVAAVLLLVVSLLTTLGWTGAAWGQAQVARVGILSFASTADEPMWASYMGLFSRTLADKGWIDGKTVSFEYRSADSDPSQFAVAATALAGLNVDVIFASGAPALRAAYAATRTIPIVAGDFTTDVITEGYVESYAQPGGNVTGVFLDAPEIAGKWFELLKAMIPDLERVSVVWDPDSGSTHLQAVRSVAKIFDIELQIVEVRTPNDIDKAFSTLRSQAIIILPSPMTYGQSARLAELTLKHRLPATSMDPEFANSGGALAYGPEVTSTVERLALLVAKILDGGNPAELPVERPSKIQLVVNLKTAKALGITIPQSILIRADEVIR